MRERIELVDKKIEFEIRNINCKYLVTCGKFPLLEVYSARTPLLRAIKEYTMGILCNYCYYY